MKKEIKYTISNSELVLKNVTIEQRENRNEFKFKFKLIEQYIIKKNEVILNEC